VLLAGHFFDALPKSHVTRWIGLMLVLAILSVLVLMFLPSWGLSQSWNSGIVMACLALFGFTVAPAYYLPMSIFAIEYGGPHSGFLIAYLDAMGFAASMVFSFIGGAVADQSAGWNSFLLLILSVAVFSWILTVAFLVGEAKVVRNLENHRQSPA
jgi:MFS family permease